MIINIILNDAFISNYIYCMEIYAEKYFILLLDFFYLDIYPRYIQYKTIKRCNTQTLIPVVIK